MTVLFQRPAPSNTGARGNNPTPPAPGTRRGDDAEIRQIVERRLVSAEFQPLVNLTDRQPWAYEALARGPASSPLGAPGAMFAAAARLGLAGQLDRVAHAAAYGVVLDNCPDYRLPLTINTGPQGLTTPNPPDLTDLTDRAHHQFPIIVELAETAITTDPLAALTAITHARTNGLHIAIDNLGLNPAAFPLLPLLQPDLIKLDRSLVTDPRAAQTLIHALADYLHHTHTPVVAQGIEHEHQLDLATAIGAHYGQGYLFGRPLPMPKTNTPTPHTTWHPTPPAPTTDLPKLGPDSPATDLATIRHIAALITRRAEAHPDPAVIILLSPTGGLTADTWLLPRALVKRSALTLLLTPDEIRKPIPDVTTHTLAGTDPLATQFTLAVLTTDTATLLTAQPGNDGPTGPYHYQITHNRDDAYQTCRTLLQRFTTPTPS